MCIIGSIGPAEAECWHVSDMEERSWHGLGVDETLLALTSSKDGLTPEEARKRLARFGPNELRKEKTVSWWMMLLGQFKNVLIIILLAAAVSLWS